VSLLVGYRCFSMLALFLFYQRGGAGDAAGTGKE
jgi:hypothetical protein